jgi:Ca-activated chloride channel family protein
MVPPACFYPSATRNNYSGKEDEMVLMGKIAFAILPVFIAVMAKSQDNTSVVAKGNDLYKKQQFEQAAEQYRKAADLNTKDPKAQYNLGDALFRAKDGEAAEKAFNDAAAITKDGTAKSKALYNKGVTFSASKKLLESIQAYKESLRLNSTDEEARQNLQKALNELKKQSQQNQQKQDKKQDKKQNQNQPEQQKNNSRLNQKQVEQMLSALRKDEKKLQQDIQKRNNIGKSNSKDW